MPYHLSLEKQTTAIHALCEGSSIRSVERMTNIHRDTIMKLGVRVGKACQVYMDDTFRNLTCRKVQVDEIWGYVGKKQNRLTEEDNKNLVGDTYTFVAIDEETKLVPSYFVGKRNYASAKMFMEDLASRMTNRIHLSSDGFNSYSYAVERGFGQEVDYGQLVKTLEYDIPTEEKKYSPPRLVSLEKKAIIGKPRSKDICTAHVERQNLTMRMHCRRLTRLTNAFSKKLENFRAAVALNFGYYNLVRTHNSLRCTPAMAAGVVSSVFSVQDLVRLSYEKN